MPSVAAMPDDFKPPCLLIQHPSSPAQLEPAEPYYVLSARDSLLAARLGEEIAATHLRDYLNGRFTDLAEFDSPKRAWYEAIGAYALRYCRRAWRVYAYEQAVDRGVAVVADCLTHCFLERSDVNPNTLVKMPPAKIRAMVGILATEIINAHRNALDGTSEPSPADILRLHAESRTK